MIGGGADTQKIDLVPMLASDLSTCTSEQYRKLRSVLIQAYNEAFADAMWVSVQNYETSMQLIVLLRTLGDFDCPNQEAV